MGGFGGAFWESWGDFGWFFLLRRSFWVVFLAEVGDGVAVGGGCQGGKGRAPRGQGGTHGAGERSGRPKARENVGGGAKGHGNGNEVGRRAVRKENEAGGDDRGGRGAKKKLWEQGAGGEGRCGRARVHQRRVLVGVGWVGATGDGVAVNVGRWGVVGRRQGRKVTARRRGGGGAVEGRLGVLGSGFDGLSGRAASLQRRSNPLVARTGEF